MPSDPLKQRKDLAFKEELEFQLKLRPDADPKLIEAQVRERIYGVKKKAMGGRMTRGSGKAFRGNVYRIV